ncbi:MAG: hypothetical protein HOV94_11450, partial [Saccharothrix sp.]|nr:hypothetical protein [Saccharothrix sp.]
PSNLVDEICLFGSYIRGALQVGDIDVAVQHSTDKRWVRESMSAFFDGRDSYVSMRQALRGRRRGVSFQFQARRDLEEDGIAMLLLWKRGEPVALARERLAAITADPAAGRAPRDHVLPGYAHIADLLPRPVRIDLYRWCTEKSVTLSVLALPDARPRSTAAARHVDFRWTQASPLRRAAAAALAHLEHAGQPLERVELHNQYLDFGTAAGPVDCFVDLGLRYWYAAERHLDAGQSWFEVLPATARQPLHALSITPSR